MLLICTVNNDLSLSLQSCDFCIRSGPRKVRGSSESGTRWPHPTTKRWSPSELISKIYKRLTRLITNWSTCFLPSPQSTRTVRKHWGLTKPLCDGYRSHGRNRFLYLSIPDGFDSTSSIGLHDYEIVKFNYAPFMLPQRNIAGSTPHSRLFGIFSTTYISSHGIFISTNVLSVVLGRLAYMFRVLR